MNITVAGAGGAIGGHLVERLVGEGHAVRAVDIKPKNEWWQIHANAHNYPTTDLRVQSHADKMVDGSDQVYDLAENMGGIGFIEANRVDCAESVEIGIALLRAAAKYRIDRFFFASSACVYPTHLQTPPSQTSPSGVAQVRALHETHAWPAQPEQGYGFSKLYMEELCRHYTDEQGLKTRVARYHNVYGPPASWNDGKEKSPAAICRKVANAVHNHSDHISIWGNGRQVRSYLYVSDCIEGTIRLMESDVKIPLNIGSSDAITINDLSRVIQAVAGVELDHQYDMTGALGVGGRNADVRQAKEFLGWEPQVPLPTGLGALYRWIENQISIGASSAHTSAPPATTAVPA